MKIKEFFIRQAKVNNAKDAVMLLLKLVLLAIIADETYNAFHIIPCLLGDRLAVMGITWYVFGRVLFFTFIYCGYRIIKRFNRTMGFKKASIIFITAGVVIWLLNGSFFFIYYMDGPYWGKVVDADTGEPIADANVMAKWNIEYITILESTSFADARETVTDSKGRFFIFPGRKIWLYPFSNLRLEQVYIYKSGYDCHPPHMYQAWSDVEKEKWKEKLVMLNPRYKHRLSPGTNYYQLFRKIPKVYKPTIIKLNKALSREEQNESKYVVQYGGYGCEYFKITKFNSALKEKRLK